MLLRSLLGEDGGRRSPAAGSGAVTVAAASGSPTQVGQAGRTPEDQAHYREVVRLIRRHRPPEDLTARLPLDPGEHLLTWAPVRGGGHAVATDRGLWLADPQGSARRDWTSILRAVWNPDSSALQVEVLTPAGRERYRIVLAEPSTLPETVRDRVTASVQFSQHVRLAAEGGVRIVARKGPDGETQWQLVFDDEMDAGDPQVSALAQQELARLQRETGL